MLGWQEWIEGTRVHAEVDRGTQTILRDESNLRSQFSIVVVKWLLLCNSCRRFQGLSPSGFVRGRRVWRSGGGALPGPSYGEGFTGFLPLSSSFETLDQAGEDFASGLPVSISPASASVRENASWRGRTERVQPCRFEPVERVTKITVRTRSRDAGVLQRIGLVRQDEVPFHGEFSGPSPL